MKGKVAGKRLWDPLGSEVERSPDRLIVSHEQPGIMAVAHWHAQVEVNYVFRGAVTYRMKGRRVELAAGALCVFWGGTPHQVVDTAPDSLHVAIHLPLVHFFRLRLPAELQRGLMRGAALLTSRPDSEDDAAFNRWSAWMRAGDPARAGHAVEELLLRIERIRFAPHRFLPAPRAEAGPEEPPDPPGFPGLARICAFVAENFREDIGSADIALSADIHPKYAMSVFKKSTGMTLIEYVSLLRLSHAQAMLMQADANVLQAAMESGFGSLSAFNKCFRKMAGMSPSDFKRGMRARPRPAQGAAPSRPAVGELG